jgi:hypothetical protein
MFRVADGAKTTPSCPGRRHESDNSIMDVGSKLAALFGWQMDSLRRSHPPSEKSTRVVAYLDPRSYEDNDGVGDE